jgi:hypothetical protein
MPLYPGSMALMDEAAPTPLPDAPTLASSLIEGFSASTTVHDVSTTGLTVAGLDVYSLISTSASGASITSYAGADDTSVAVGGVDTNPRLLLRKVTVVSALDAVWTLTLGASSRPVVCSFSIDGLGTLLTLATKTGAGPTLPNHDTFVLTGGPYNVLVVDAMNIQGVHTVNPPIVPTGGHTSVRLSYSDATNNPTSAFRTTLAVARRTYMTSDLVWEAGEATIPAATWGGLADIGTQTWRTMRMVFIP